ncbi:hypothetical protein FRB97_005201, partial [Tulasnella sp. 331]
MIKSNPGSGYVENVPPQKFIGSGSACELDVDSYWSFQASGTGAGVQLTNLTFQ